MLAQLKLLPTEASPQPLYIHLSNSLLLLLFPLLETVFLLPSHVNYQFFFIMLP